MKSDWNILFFTKLNGRSPIEEYLYESESRLQAKTSNSLHLLEEFGPHLSLPHSKRLSGTDIFELRILGSDSTRILYARFSSNTFIILHIFKKKQNKIPRAALKLAVNRYSEVLKQNK
ncbi:type II toxin-antitoxin system RelE/ParE family toxin [Candidatus Woesebacteria bacterium]|nr:type II toxin-antitoxin system RelE/ParE family toxin [Candidatus Woesebacteria bacterium]